MGVGVGWTKGSMHGVGVGLEVKVWGLFLGGWGGGGGGGWTKGSMHGVGVGLEVKVWGLFFFFFFFF